MDRLMIRPLDAMDIEAMAEAFQRVKWSKSAQLMDRYLRAQQAGRRDVLVGWLNDQFAGYLTVLWESSYGAFRDAGIPEINDFNVMPELRQQGIGSRLMDDAERIISERSAYSGIGVGMGADYGPAQRMYVLRGYVPDGRGLMDNMVPVTYGDKILVSHNLAIYLTRKLR